MIDDDRMPDKIIGLEINMRLATLAGFKTDLPTAFNESKPEITHVARYWWEWLYPDGIIHETIPDFVNDLNACVKYLGPKFEGWTVKFVGYHNGIRKYEAMVEKGEGHTANSEQPSHAFALAALKALEH